jgi:hypothetical protein
MRTMGIIALVIGCGLAWCKLAYPTYTYHYRMTVNVEADGNIHSDSSVIEVRLVKQVQFMLEVPRVETEISGEAVFVDLGQGRNVIELLTSGDNVDYPKYLVAKHFNLSYSDENLAKFPKLDGRWELMGDELPTFLTFTDLNDPKTARVVRPDELETVFDPGVRFKRAFVEMVPAGTWPFNVLGWPRALAGEPVTRGIAKQIPEIIRQLREQAKTMQLRRPNDPYTARLGHFYIRG